jgi:hypothetical protein
MVLIRRLLATLLLFGAFPATAAWHEAKSKHFIIYADSSPADLKAYAERLERFDQAVRRVRAMSDPALTDAQRLRIFALKDEAAVGRLVGSSSISGLYLTTAAGSFAFVPREAGYDARRAESSPETVFFHEYAHHLQLGGTAAALPAWMTEGFAEFFSTAEIMSDGSVRIGRPPKDREWWVQRYDGFTITEMLAGSMRNASAREVASLYGRGWLLTHMLTFSTERRGQMKRYVDALQNGTDPLKAAKDAFGDDLRSLNGDLDRYLRQRQLNTLVVNGSSLSIGPIAIRPLRPGEAAAMDIIMELRPGVDRKEAARLAARARKLAAAHPNDDVAQTTLSEAEFEAGNYAAAAEAGARAAALNPASTSAAIATGKAKLELARQAPASANWNEIRSWFLRANKMDPENAEPLMLYYQSFVAAGAKPTANATKGLLYAVVLAPRDENLRIEAVRQLVVEDQLKEARTMFGPIAFYPHSGDEWRKRKAQIMDALAQSDRQAALALIDAEQAKRRTED